MLSKGRYHYNINFINVIRDYRDDSNIEVLLYVTYSFLII